MSMSEVSPTAVLERLRVRQSEIHENFVMMAIRALSKSTAEEVENQERALAELFETLMPGEGSRWVLAVFEIARSIQARVS